MKMSNIVVQTPAEIRQFYYWPMTLSFKVDYRLPAIEYESLFRTDLIPIDE